MRGQPHNLRREAIGFLGSPHLTNISLPACTISPLSIFFPTTFLPFHLYRCVIAISIFPFYLSNKSGKPSWEQKPSPLHLWSHQKHVIVSQEFWLPILVLPQVVHPGPNCPWKERIELKWLLRFSSPYPYKPTKAEHQFFSLSCFPINQWRMQSHKCQCVLPLGCEIWTIPWQCPCQISAEARFKSKYFHFDKSVTFKKLQRIGW